jgi:hypothetical protein
MVCLRLVAISAIATSRVSPYGRGENAELQKTSFLLFLLDRVPWLGVCGGGYDEL